MNMFMKITVGGVLSANMAVEAKKQSWDSIVFAKDEVFDNALIQSLIQGKPGRQEHGRVQGDFRFDAIWFDETQEIRQAWFDSHNDQTSHQTVGDYISHLDLKFSAGKQSGGQSGDPVRSLGPLVVKYHKLTPEIPNLPFVQKYHPLSENVADTGKMEWYHEELTFFNRLMKNLEGDADRAFTNADQPVSLAGACKSYPALSAPIAAFIVHDYQHDIRVFITVMPDVGHESSDLKFQVSEGGSEEDAKLELKSLINAFSRSNDCVEGKGWFLDLKGRHGGNNPRGSKTLTQRSKNNKDKDISRLRKQFRAKARQGESNPFSKHFVQHPILRNQKYKAFLALLPNDAATVMNHLEKATEYLETRGVMDYSFFVKFHVQQIDGKYAVFAHYGIIDFTKLNSNNQSALSNLKQGVADLRNSTVASRVLGEQSYVKADTYRTRFLSGIADVLGFENTTRVPLVKSGSKRNVSEAFGGDATTSEPTIILKRKLSK